ncbi:MAG: LysR family transcriptional regulator [Acetatifactor sp.]|nr:LysR family transcriptional regulator [Acetatifactor sp.]MDE7113563.1 LysR family transcriptional regulator [Acetatifactor sp.]
MLKQIKYFQAVVRCGSFTEAADECYISQSAISQQIQALEQTLGIKLLDRRNRKFSVTPAGEYFYRKSLLWVDDFEKMCRETVRIAHRDEPQLHIGYLKCYSGGEFQQAVAEFAEKHPDIAIHIINGNHEELYDELRLGRVDLVLSDQRRAFSDEYVNFVLTASECCVEVSGRSPIAELESVNVQDLTDIPCILVASQSQRENERSYYHDVVGIRGDFLFAENLEEARLLVAGGKGFLPVEGGRQAMQLGTTLRHVPLLRNGKSIRRNYCAFWKADNSGYYIEEFANILKSKFEV